MSDTPGDRLSARPDAIRPADPAKTRTGGAPRGDQDASIDGRAPAARQACPDGRDWPAAGGLARPLLSSPGPRSATSLRFYGTGAGGIDRVKIRIDGPPKPADVGASDFTLEWWMRPLPGENASDAVACDTNDGWITGNIIFDRDVFGDGDHGDFGVSLTGGRIAFGVSAGGAGNTICGATVVADGAWHHVAVTRQKSTASCAIYVDGVLDAEGAGNVGSNADVCYRDGRADLLPGLRSVPGDRRREARRRWLDYPSYHGWIDEVRLSTDRALHRRAIHAAVQPLRLRRRTPRRSTTSTRAPAT